MGAPRQSLGGGEKAASVFSMEKLGINVLCRCKQCFEMPHLLAHARRCGCIIHIDEPLYRHAVQKFQRARQRLSVQGWARGDGC